MRLKPSWEPGVTAPLPAQRLLDPPLGQSELCHLPECPLVSGTIVLSVRPAHLSGCGHRACLCFGVWASGLPVFCGVGIGLACLLGCGRGASPTGRTLHMRESPPPPVFPEDGGAVKSCTGVTARLLGGWSGLPGGRGAPGGLCSQPPGLCLSPAEQVHRHLDQHEVRYLQFAFRWMNNLLMREVPLRCTIRLWDTYQVSARLPWGRRDPDGPPPPGVWPCPLHPTSCHVLLWVCSLHLILPSERPLGWHVGSSKSISGVLLTRRDEPAVVSLVAEVRLWPGFAGGLRLGQAGVGEAGKLAALPETFALRTHAVCVLSYF